MRARRGIVVSTGLAPMLLLVLAGAAAADAPTKTGWWNAASANGVALPQPTTDADNLHVGQGPSGPSAYSAVSYDLLGQTVSSAVLELKVAPHSAVGAIDVQACPTKDSAWKAGGNQPYDSRPAYDCAKGIQGLAATDGTKVTFVLDTAQQLAGLGYSLAIVPSADAKPFQVDFVKPDATSLAPQVEAPPPVEPGPVAPAPTFAAPPGAGFAATAPLAAGTVDQAPAPDLAAPVTAPVVPAPAPAVAPVAPVAVVPAASSARPVPVSNRVRYEAGTLLALLAGFLVWSYQQKAPEPRLIGGMARKAGPEAVLPVDAAPRGIGRFATLRTAPARRLV